VEGAMDGFVSFPAKADVLLPFLVIGFVSATVLNFYDQGLMRLASVFSLYIFFPKMSFA